MARAPPSTSTTTPGAATLNLLRPLVQKTGVAAAAARRETDELVAMEQRRVVAEQMRTRGNTALALGKLDDALRFYSLALSTLGDFRPVLVNRLLLQCLISNPTAALPDCSRLQLRDTAAFAHAYRRARPLFKTDVCAAVGALESDLRLGDSDVSRILGASPDARTLVKHAMLVALQHRQAARLADATSDMRNALRRRAARAHGTALPPTTVKTEVVDSISIASDVDRDDDDDGGVDGSHNGRASLLEHSPPPPLEVDEVSTRAAVQVAVQVSADVNAADRQLTKCVAAAETHRLAGNQAYARGRYDDAVARYTRALDELQRADSAGAPVQQDDGCSVAPATASVAVTSELAQWRATLLANRSLAHYFNWRVVESLRDADAALTLQPDFFEAHFRRARALIALQQDARALDALDAALRVRPCHRDALALSAAIEARLPVRADRARCAPLHFVFWH